MSIRRYHSVYLPAIIVVTLLLSMILSVAKNERLLAVEFYAEDSSPFGTEYKDWVANWWQWWIKDVHKDNVTNTMLEKNDCLANTDGQVVFLMDPTFAGAEKREKVCEITSDQGILFNFLTAECDTGLYEGQNTSYQELINCAIEDDQGILQKEAFVDGVRVPDDQIKEIFTNQFNITIGENNVYDAVPGTYPAAAHGYYVFLQPLPVGEHTVQYKSALFGVPYGFTADILYRLNVKE